MPISKNKVSFALSCAAALICAAIFRMNLSALLLLVLLTVYYKIRFPNGKAVPVSNLLLLLLIALASFDLVVWNSIPIYFIPFSVVPMLATLLFGSIEISFLLTLAIAVACASFTKFPYYLILLFLISGILSGILSLGARKRTTIIKAGAIVGIVQFFAAIFGAGRWWGFSGDYLLFVVNGVACSAIVLGTLPVFEYLFKTVTNISLLELADFNHPLLQRLTLEAPGTYHHSLIVGNLAESACNAVGANALLARIGAYYHDIGKLGKAEYFSENQMIASSKHDALSPTMSKLIIMNHVKEGVELAKKYKLNPPITEFISRHHGNSLVYYFYRRALETIEEDQQVKEEGFRYAGPKPNTKETAIVLLADSVEAATRALKDPTPAKIEELVHKVINNKFIDGQLDECELALKDIEKISAVFIRILSGIYHSRVSYEGASIEHHNKKPAKETANPAAKDKKASA